MNLSPRLVMVSNYIPITAHTTAGKSITVAGNLAFQAGVSYRVPDGQQHSPLFGFDAGGLDDFWPTLQLALDEGVELLRGAADDLGGLRFRDGLAHRR